MTISKEASKKTRSFRCTEEQGLLIDEAVKRSGLKISEYILSKLLDDYLPPPTEHLLVLSPQEQLKMIRCTFLIGELVGKICEKNGDPEWVTEALEQAKKSCPER